MFERRVMICGQLVLLALCILATASCRRSGTNSTGGAESEPVARSDESAPVAAKPPGRADDAVVKLIDELSAAWEKIDKLSVTVEFKALRDLGDKADSNGKGLYSYQRDGDRVRIHYYLNSNIKFFFGTDQYHTWERVEWAVDGDIMEYLVLQFENRRLVRSKYDPNSVLQLGGKILFDSLRAGNNLRLKGEDSFQGMEVYVIEAKPTDGEGLGLHYFDKKTGIRVKWLETAANGDQLLEMTVPKLNLEPALSDASFKMTPYKYIEIVDEITGQVTPAPSPTEAPSEKPWPKDQEPEPG